MVLGLSAAPNNFNALRLAFALMVVAYHMAVLPGLPEWLPAEIALSLGAEVGVQGFFVLSGFLVFGSFLRSDSGALYAEICPQTFPVDARSAPAPCASRWTGAPPVSIIEKAVLCSIALIMLAVGVVT